jgi:hypothetical protein
MKSPIEMIHEAKEEERREMEELEKEALKK